MPGDRREIEFRHRIVAPHAMSDRWLSALTDHPGLLELSGQPDRQGVMPWDIAQKKVIESGRLEGLRKVFAWSKQKFLEIELAPVERVPGKASGRPRL